MHIYLWHTIVLIWNISRNWTSIHLKLSKPVNLIFDSELKFCGFDNKRLADDKRRSAEKDERIIGGSDVSTQITMPWVVRLKFTKTEDEETTTTRCAGTVVHKKYVLTTNTCCKVSLIKWKWSNTLVCLKSGLLHMYIGYSWVTH